MCIKQKVKYVAEQCGRTGFAYLRAIYSSYAERTFVWNQTGYSRVSVNRGVTAGVTVVFIDKLSTVAGNSLICWQLQATCGLLVHVLYRQRQQRPKLEVEGDAPVSPRQSVFRAGQQHRCIWVCFIWRRILNATCKFNACFIVCFSSREGILQSVCETAHRKETL